MNRMPRIADAKNTLDVLRSQSISSAVQNEIEYRILSGTLRPGERVNENQLAKELSVSRGPIREACRGLVQSGLLTVIVNRGFFVREVTRKDATDVYEIRASLMRLAGETLAQRITPAQVEILRDLVVQMDRMESEDDFDAFYDLNTEFHDRIIDFTENDRLRALCDGLSNELHLYRSRSLMEGGGLKVSNREHWQILNALESRDAARAGAALEAHIQAGKQRFLAATDTTNDESSNDTQGEEAQ